MDGLDRTSSRQLYDRVCNYLLTRKYLQKIEKFDVLCLLLLCFYFGQLHTYERSYEEFTPDKTCAYINRKY